MIVRRHGCYYHPFLRSIGDRMRRESWFVRGFVGDPDTGTARKKRKGKEKDRVEDRMVPISA